MPPTTQRPGGRRVSSGHDSDLLVYYGGHCAKRPGIFAVAHYQSRTRARRLAPLGVPTLSAPTGGTGYDVQNSPTLGYRWWPQWPPRSGASKIQAPCRSPRHKPQGQEIKQLTITIRGAQFPAALTPISPLPGYQVHHNDQLQLFGGELLALIVYGEFVKARLTIIPPHRGDLHRPIAEKNRTPCLARAGGLKSAPKTSHDATVLPISVAGATYAPVGSTKGRNGADCTLPG